MSKKYRSDDDDEMDDDIDGTEENYPLEDDSDDDSDSDDVDYDIDIDDSDDDINIVIEIEEDDLDLTKIEIEVTKEEDDKDIVLSKHKIEGKHSLKYDSIFKGKKEDPLNEEDDTEMFSGYFKETIEVDKSSQYHHESIDNEVYIRAKRVKERVYEVLKDKTQLNFLNNRRKPSRIDFNNYYELLKNNLKEDSFTNTEIFNELSVYFSDNLFNMFKLLDNKWRNLIIDELQDHIGNNRGSKEVTNRNIYEGTEIEFIWEDKLITGVVLTTDYESSTFIVDSYENIYDISIDDITKILNNTKFKYNLNKLNNIDFL
jgi:hypothetical protein